MAKARYKIGMLVSAKKDHETDASFGTVDAVITRADGHSYTVSGYEYTEGEILSAYREVKPRAMKPARTPKAKSATAKKAAKKEAEAHA